MADVMRWRYGDTNPVVFEVDSSTVIEIGDLLYLVADDVRAASSFPDAGTEALNQEGFHDLFAGVAMQRSRDGDTDPVRVATTGVFDFDCPSGAFEVGDLVGVDEAASGTALENQKVDGVAGANLGVGRVAKRVNPAGTHVLVSVVSTIMLGGPQDAAETAVSDCDAGICE